MSFQPKTCVEIICDGGCEWSGGWEDGTPHFDSEVQAMEYVRNCGWLVTTERALCARCAVRALCEATGHEWDDWYDASQHGIQIRQRMCDRCSTLDWDPPFKELYPKFQTLRDAEQILAEAKAEHQLEILQCGTPGNTEEDGRT